MKVETATIFEPTIQKTEQWLSEIGNRIDSDEPQDAYRALRAVLMTVRDRITVEEATDLGAQLPMLVRGFYYENWNPSQTPTKEQTQDEFLAHVAQLLDAPTIDSKQATEAVFTTLQEHVTAGEIRHVRENLPKEIQALWSSSS